MMFANHRNGGAAVGYFIVVNILVALLSSVSEARSGDLSSDAKFAIIGGGASSTGCPAEFQGECLCGATPNQQGPYKGMYVTNCTNQGFDDSTMLQHVPIETEILIFVGNDIYDLHFNIFGHDNTLDRLHTVDLSNNHIQTIKGRTFHNVNSVRRLILNDNDLYIVSKDFHPRMFSNFAHLETLEMRNALSDKDVKVNMIKYLANLAETFNQSSLVNLKNLDLSENGFGDFRNTSFFHSLPVLEKLNLRNNKMTSFDVDVSILPHLKSLDLSNNAFPYLRRSTLTSLASYPRLKINLSGNPLRCDCRMKDTYLYLLKHVDNVIDKEDYVCFEGTPNSNVGKSLFELDPRDLQCDELKELKADSFEGHLHVSYIVLGLVCVVFFVLLVVMIFRNRKVVQSMALRVSEPVRNKFNYSSLDKKDVEAEMEV